MAGRKSKSLRLLQEKSTTNDVKTKLIHVLLWILCSTKQTSTGAAPIVSCNNLNISGVVPNSLFLFFFNYCKLATRRKTMNIYLSQTTAGGLTAG